MYPDSGYKTTHAQSVCTRPFSRGEGPGDEARVRYCHTYMHAEKNLAVEGHTTKFSGYMIRMIVQWWAIFGNYSVHVHVCRFQNCL